VQPRERTRSTLGIGQEKLVFVVVANLIPYKGHDDLVAAFARIADRLPDWVCLCAGGGAKRAEALAERAQAAGLGLRVRFLGPRDDVPDLLAAADLAILPSHEEGFPNAAIEAMAAGLPLIATRVGGIPEAVVDGLTGVLVSPHEPDALAGAILRLATSPETRSAMGAAGRVRAREEFGLEKCVGRYATLYERLIAGVPLNAE
jgi:glycosyltransferase involved in cell wall biosynthesis